MWLGSEIGLHRFDPLTSRFTIYGHRPDDAHSLSDNRVNSVYFDHAGTLWAGTQDGLDKFDPRTNSFSVYGEQQGMSGNVVSCVLEDGQGSLWMSTNKGISNFDPRTEVFKNYTVADGLPGDDLTGWGACFKSRAGEMFFGGFSGATAFFPERIVDDIFVPRIALTEFRLFGAPMQRGHDSPLANSINHTDQITLSHSQNIFSIEFSALSYLDAATSRFRYTLEGLDDKWNEQDSDRRVASYTTLPPGTYTFRVQVASSHGPWGEPGAIVRIRILPPWWGSLWFRLLSTLAIVATLWMLYLFRLHQVAAELRGRMEERLRERERIARELHDTLLQSFQGLILKFQRARNLLPARPVQAMESLDTALDKAERAIMEGRDAIHDIRSFTPVGRDLAEELSALGEELAVIDGRSSLPSLRVVVEGSPKAVQPLARNELLQIAREALRNAHTHADARNIEAEIRYEDRMLRVRIRDDGRGINQEHLGEAGRAGHYGLRGMRERAAQIGARLDIWSEQGAGTEIDLSIPDRVAYKLDGERQGDASDK